MAALPPPVALPPQPNDPLVQLPPAPVFPPTVNNVLEAVKYRRDVEMSFRGRPADAFHCFSPMAALPLPVALPAQPNDPLVPLPPAPVFPPTVSNALEYRRDVEISIRGRPADVYHCCSPMAALPLPVALPAQPNDPLVLLPPAPVFPPTVSNVLDAVKYRRNVEISIRGRPADVRCTPNDHYSSIIYELSRKLQLQLPPKDRCSAALVQTHPSHTHVGKVNWRTFNCMAFPKRYGNKKATISWNQLKSLEGDRMDVQSLQYFWDFWSNKGATTGQDRGDYIDARDCLVSALLVSLQPKRKRNFTLRSSPVAKSNKLPAQICSYDICVRKAGAILMMLADETLGSSPATELPRSCAAQICPYVSGMLAAAN
ncbi:hypothetical protein JOM56_000278 [Amanita muscaria]